MVYGRTYGDKTLNFEASGALMKASLIMRDRETDSWWSIMTSDSIGGDLEGTDLRELPLGEKSTWKDWRSRHPKTLVLSVDGKEHDDKDPYAGYFSSDKTFRGLEVADDRLAPKAPIFSFWHDDTPYAVAHASIADGGLFELEDGTSVYLYRKSGLSMFASTDAYILAGDVADRSVAALRKLAGKKSGSALAPLNGFDTFWYSWVTINEKSKLLE